jgi:hypothetical protein
MMYASVGKMLVGTGIFLVVAGLGILLAGRFGINMLPGDLLFKRGRTTIYFPIVTCIVVSVVLSLIMSLVARWHR